MKITTAIEEGFTHSGHMFHFLPAYFMLNEDESFSVVGSNFVSEKLITFLTVIDMFLGTGYSFEFYLDDFTLKDQIVDK